MNIGLIRCEKNESRCPLTSCIKSVQQKKEGFAQYDDAALVGVFTCKCPGDAVKDFSAILKAKGAEAIHFCTCAFSHKEDGRWTLGDGFCKDIDALAKSAAEAAGIPCVKGSAHLPEGYHPEVFEGRGQ